MDRVLETPLPASNDLRIVGQYARRVMDSFGLAGWTFGYDNARRRFGQCDSRHRRITMSRHFVTRNGPAEIRETLLHEVAHALVGPGHGHDAAWKAMARRVGARPVRCGNADMPKGRWRAACPSCSRAFHRHRRPPTGRRMWCRACGRDRGQLAFRLVGEEE